MAGVSRRRDTRTTRVDAGYRAVPDRIWVADITCVLPWTGFVYLAVVHRSDKGSQYTRSLWANGAGRWGYFP